MVVRSRQHPQPAVRLAASIQIPLGEWLHGDHPRRRPEDSRAARSPRLRARASSSASSPRCIIANARLTSAAPNRGSSLDIAHLGGRRSASSAPRLYHVLTHPDDYFGPGKNVWNLFEPGSIWAIWEGGGAIFGALIGGAIGVCDRLPDRRPAVLERRRRARARHCSLAQASAASATGSTRNSSAFRPTCRGASRSTARTRRSRTGSPDDVLFHPTFLYEIIWNLAGFGSSS